MAVVTVLYVRPVRARSTGTSLRRLSVHGAHVREFGQAAIVARNLASPTGSSRTWIASIFALFAAIAGLRGTLAIFIRNSPLSSTKFPFRRCRLHRLVSGFHKSRSGEIFGLIVPSECKAWTHQEVFSPRAFRASGEDDGRKAWHDEDLGVLLSSYMESLGVSSQALVSVSYVCCKGSMSRNSGS